MPDDVAFDRFFAVIRRRIKRLRLINDLSQEEAAGRVPMDARILQRYEAEEPDVSDPRLKTLHKIAIAINVELHELLRPPTEEELAALLQVQRSANDKRSKPNR